MNFSSLLRKNWHSALQGFEQCRKTWFLPEAKLVAIKVPNLVHSWHCPGWDTILFWGFGAVGRLKNFCAARIILLQNFCTKILGLAEGPSERADLLYFLEPLMLLRCYSLQASCIRTAFALCTGQDIDRSKKGLSCNPLSLGCLATPRCSWQRYKICDDCESLRLYSSQLLTDKLSVRTKVHETGCIGKFSPVSHPRR